MIKVGMAFSYDRRRRLDLLVQEIRGAASFAITDQGDKHVVRAELAPGSRRVSILDDEEHAYVKDQLAGGPRTLASASFGTLDRDELVPSWRGSLGGIGIRIYDVGGGAAAKLGELETALMSTLVDVGTLRHAAGERLYETYRRSWVDDSGRVVDRAQFEALLSVRNASIDIDARVTIELDDGALFGGHSILVSVRDGHVLDVELAG